MFAKQSSSFLSHLYIYFVFSKCSHIINNSIIAIATIIVSVFVILNVIVIVPILDVERPNQPLHCHHHHLHSHQPVLELGLPGEGSTGLNLLADKQGVITDNQGVITDNCRYLRNV